MLLNFDFKVAYSPSLGRLDDEKIILFEAMVFFLFLPVLFGFFKMFVDLQIKLSRVRCWGLDEFESSVLTGGSLMVCVIRLEDNYLVLKWVYCEKLLQIFLFDWICWDAFVTMLSIIFYVAFLEFFHMSECCFSIDWLTAKKIFMIIK